ncbi:MAG: HupE/UreJ family protein, partial [Bacteroidia bacterium]
SPTGSIVEPIIALSIFFVAAENLITDQLKPTRVLLVFAFGLIHGMGFAGVLGELGLPKGEFATALILFNVGVELGQIVVILGLWLLIGLWFSKKTWYRKRIVMPLSVAIALIALYWTIERIFFT